MAQGKSGTSGGEGCARHVLVRVAQVAGLLLVAGVIASFVFLLTAYPVGEEAQAAIVSDDEVRVTDIGYGWYFDGEGTRDLMVFMGGAEVDERAYAPLARGLAEAGVDVCVVRAPLHFALLALDGPARPIGELVQESDRGYERVIVGGHSLGGLVAGWYASAHPDEVSALALLAAYTTRDIDDAVACLLVAGTEDGVLNWESYEWGKEHLSGGYREVLIEGGNHAQFGCYGEQFLDGQATVSGSEQVEQTVEAIRSFMGE
jgi:hypothetical protein